MADSNSKKDFFISRNEADRGWAAWVAWELEEEGHTTILQDWDFLPGENFILRMNQASQQADHTIAILSQNYLDAEYTQPEWAAAFARGGLIPVRVRECELQGLLRQIIYIDLVGLGEQSAREKLLDGVRRVLAGALGERIKKRTDFPGDDARPVPDGRSVAERPDFPGPTKTGGRREVIPGGRRRILWQRRMPYAAAVLLFAILAVVLWPWLWVEPDCGDIQTTCLRLDLAAGAGQTKCLKDGDEIATKDISSLQELSGEAMLPAPARANNCPCEWHGGTNNGAKKISSSRNCLFSLDLHKDLPNGVETIILSLGIQKQTKTFTIHVRKNSGE